MSYKLHAPTWASLMAQAARLRILDDAAVSAAKGPDRRAAAQAQRLADDERKHAAASALPPAWRCRDKTTAPEWPPFDDLDLWRALAASHALLLLTPSLQPSNHPHAIAYTQGYTAIQGAYLMPDSQQPPTVSTNIVALAASKHLLSEADLANYMLTGDVTDLNPNAQAQVLVAMARHVGLDPLERPFMLMRDGKKTVVYARAACSDALCRERKIDTELISVEEREICGTQQVIARSRSSVLELDLLAPLLAAGLDAAVAVAAATRSKTAVGAVAVKQPETEWKQNDRGKNYKEVTGWREPTPDEASNLWMKATTKAERRAVLKLVGLGGVVDETELETIDPANNGHHYTIEVETDEPEAIVNEPLCSGKGQPIADTNRGLRIEYSNMIGADVEKVWGSVIRSLFIPCSPMPEPEHLTITQGRNVTEKLRQAIDLQNEEPPEEANEQEEPNS